jgi:regulator of sirC expression with transglutaminase-like and TPR domain
VIEEGRGIPLSLAAIYILVGGRMGFEVAGVNFPGHFLAKTRYQGTVYVLDCYNGGRFLGEDDLAAFGRAGAVQITQLVNAPCLAETIIARCLRNLNHAYRQEDQPENAAFMLELLRSMDAPGRQGS